jgi:phosphoglucomutase/phosphomannomutase
MPSTDYQSALAAAVGAGKLSAGAAENIRIWLTKPAYAPYVAEIARHIESDMWKELDDAFWTVIPFGTGGRRGRMYAIGSNAINDRTIGESAQGLADYVRATCGAGPHSCAIAYDTRHRSPEFARLCAEIMAAAGFTVYFLDGHRSTPELSFAVRYKKCSCGIMVTASHNPPSDNAVKVYWSTGGQLVPPHDEGVIERVYRVEQIERRPFDEAAKAGQIVKCQAEVDPAYVAAASKCALGGARDLKVIYSPLHGVGAMAVVPVLAAAGFGDVEVFGPHAAPSGDFPNVPGHVSNPENPAVFDAIIARAREASADLVLASDPDCDRIGCAAPTTRDPKGPWGTFTGNQIGALLAEYVLERTKAAGKLSREHYVVKTLVTTELIRRIATAYGAATYGNLHVGFKWIGEEMDRRGPEKFLLGCEESHGYLVGTYARDKDGAVAALLLAELASKLKAEGKSLHEKLDALYWQYGCHVEKTVSVTMSGSEGMARMREVMTALRQTPPARLAGHAVSAVRDYLGLRTFRPTVGCSASTSAGTDKVLTEHPTKTEPLDSPPGDMVILDLDPPGNYVAVRPSGTEPKIKFYLFAYESAEMLANLEETKQSLDARLAAVSADLRTFCGA